MTICRHSAYSDGCFQNQIKIQYAVVKKIMIEQVAVVPYTILLSISQPQQLNGIGGFGEVFTSHRTNEWKKERIKM